MSVREEVIELVWAAVDALNALQASDRQLEKNLESKLFGQGGAIDSLALVQLVSELETRLEDHFAISVALADERAMSQSRSPFRTLGTLVDYAVTIITEAKKA